MHVTPWWGVLAMLMLILAMSTQLAVAQDVSVTGKISDSTGRALPGVSVSIKGTTRSTNSDADGNYQISAAARSVLVFSFVGFESQELTLGNQSVVNVTLAEDNKTLNEVVVIGYGTAKKKDLTGAVNTIGTKDFNKGIISSPGQLLQGRVPGVAINQNSGEPGGGINIRIRGTSSVRSNNNPLFVVDGVPLSGDATSSGGDNSGIGSTAPKNPLNFLNPDDIASVDILKDASATAIYGSRRGASTLGSLDEGTMFDEIGRETYWEGGKRIVEVRYGKYLTSTGVDKKDATTIRFPIPATAVTSNPNLRQNSGY